MTAHCHAAARVSAMASMAAQCALHKALFHGAGLEDFKEHEAKRCSAD